MTLAIDELLRQQPLSSSAIDRFLAEHEYPIVERRAGPRDAGKSAAETRASEPASVTFVYRGEADGVRLQHFVYGLETSQPFTRAEGGDLWYLTLELPPKSHVQYKLNVQTGENHRWILDPLNPKRARDPFGANSVVHTDGTERPTWTLPDPEVHPGALQEVSFYSQAFAEERFVRVFLPARARRNRLYPLLVVHDGGDYLRYSSFKTVLDNLIHRLEIAPMIVALTESGDRLKEYADDPTHARFLTEELVPFFEKEFPVRAEPTARGLMGASFGGVASLSCAWRYPGFFGCLLLQSGSFGFSDIGPHHHGPSYDPVVEFVNAFRARPGRPSEKVFVSCGMYESLIYENRSLLPVLQSTGMDIRYVEARDGHNWANWRDRLRQGLSWLFPGPLWMVYE